MREFGVDEAGKGPVLGSMFAAAVVADPAALPDDVGDSKDVAPQRRDELAVKIRSVADAVGVAEIPVERIDDGETDMNSLTVEAHVDALGAAVDAVSAAARDGLAGYVDAGDTNAVRFERRVADGVEMDLEVRGEHGADEIYDIVGAASIVAKVARDAHVVALSAQYGDLGSGYPSDPSTRAFLESYVADHDGLPACARSSWKTSQDVLAAASQSSLGEFDSGDETVTDGGTETDREQAPDREGQEPETTTLDEF